MIDKIPQTYFFCGVGGSGMSALALIILRQGHRVFGSDRAYDNGQSADKFKHLQEQGIELVPQDGSCVSEDIDALIVSSAVEDSIPDVAAAKAKGVNIRKRADLLAELFNQADIGISVAGTSGKSTVTGMIAHVLTELGQDPTVMNGAVIKDLDSNMRVGGSGIFVTETDESDGSIELYNPAIAVLNNVALDHKSIEELDQLFGDFIARATKAVVLNFDDPHVKALADRAKVPVLSYTRSDGEGLVLKLPGDHNISNALACLSVCRALELDMDAATKALESFAGIRRRMDVIGSKNNITVIDDFAHNPDKIAATLGTLKKSAGRLIVMFQPHGFGPLKLMGREIAATFAEYLEPGDILLMPEAYYAGGTADRSVTAHNVIEMAKEQGVQAKWFETRAEIQPVILENAQDGDRIIIMGARDDTLSDFAAKILEKL